MRGTTVKKINKFVQILINNTPENQRNKTQRQMVKEVRHFWYKSQDAKKFINKVVAGDVGTLMNKELN